MSIPSSALPRPRVLPAVIACVLGATIGVLAGLTAPDAGASSIASYGDAAGSGVATIAIAAPATPGR